MKKNERENNNRKPTDKVYCSSQPLAHFLFFKQTLGVLHKLFHGQLCFQSGELDGTRHEEG